MNNRIRDTYNQLANDYEHVVDTTNAYNIDYERPAMMKILPEDMSHMKVLDAGCAAGWYTLQLVNRRGKVTATDISPEMVAATKRRLGENAEILCLDLAEKLPFNDESFDLIISSLVLHYIKDWNRTFREFSRILKPNGKIIFSTHHPFMDIKLSENKDYFTPELIIDQWKRAGKLIEVPFYRRPLHVIINETSTFFNIEKVIEPQPTKAFKLKKPKKYEILMNNPHFLIVKGTKR